MSMPEPDVAQAVDQALHAAATGDENRRWELVGLLHTHGGQPALDIAARLAEHPEPAHRVLAADVLSQLGVGPGKAAIDGPFRDQALALLLAMAPLEHDPSVLASITVGFGHIGDQRCVEAMLPMHTHAEVQVRAGVADSKQLAGSYVRNSPVLK